jgi:pyridoxal phosphate enzyme (YggS family)
VSDVAARLAEVRARVDAAARAAERDPASVTLVVVTKEVALDAMRAAIDAGATDLGENRAQDLVTKAEALASHTEGLRWHFIGRLQRNKVRALAPYVALWHSLDREELIDAVANAVPHAEVLVQVNVAGEPQKGGCVPHAVPALVARAQNRGLVVRGLMTVPPAAGDPRPHFAHLRALADSCGLAECSMGMSGDFEAAIGEGATIVRVGTAVFGPRPEPRDARR